MRAQTVRTMGMVACTVLLGGCGGDAPASSTAPTAAAGLEPDQVTVTATEYAYAVPERVTGGVISLELVNEGTQPHEFGLLRLEGGHTAEEAATALADREEPEWVSDAVGVGVVGAGLSTTVTRDLPAGEYALYCFLPSPDGEPHLLLGMVQGFTAEGDSGASLPATDLEISVDETGITVPDDIPAGRQRITLRNAGQEEHEIAMIGFAEGKGEEDLEDWFGGGYPDPAPAVFPGGIQAMPAGMAVVVDLELEAGRSYTVEDFTNDLRTTFTPS